MYQLLSHRYYIGPMMTVHVIMLLDNMQALRPIGTWSKWQSKSLWFWGKTRCIARFPCDSMAIVYY